MTNSVRVFLVLGTVSAVLAWSSLRDARASTFVVTRTDDPAPDGCLSGVDCSLREAIMAANGSSGPDVIGLPAGTYDLAIAGADEDASLTGDLDIADDLTLSGAGVLASIIDANDLDRVIHVMAGVSVEIAGVTLRDGTAPVGGGVLNAGDLVVHDTVLAANAQSGVGYGAGMANDPGGVLTVRDSLISDNVAQQMGGGIANAAGATALLERVTVFNNATPSSTGGGIFNNGDTTIRDSLIEDNDALGASAIHNTSFAGVVLSIERSTIRKNASLFSSAILNEDPATLTIGNSIVAENVGGLAAIVSSGPLLLDGSLVSANEVAGVVALAPGPAKAILNSTISGNGGSGVQSDGTAAELNNVTITQNSAADGGGVFVSNNGSLAAANTIIAGNLNTGETSPDCSGTVVSLGHVLLENATGCTLVGGAGNLTGVDPLLGALADNGGLTMTHALLAGSPAIDAGSPAVPGSGGGACELLDQRGEPRPQLVRCDIGAYEVADPSDSDGDGCSDVEESGPNQLFGGLRDPAEYFDFYDVTADQAIDLADALLILDHFGHKPGDDPLDDRLDRHSPNVAQPWRTAASDTGVDLVDALLNLQSFGHSCAAP